MQDRYAADISGIPRRFEDFNRSDFTPEPSPRLQERLKHQVDAATTLLTPREHKVIGLRFGIEDGKTRTFKLIGEIMGFSETTARRAERSALNKLRHPQS